MEEYLKIHGYLILAMSHALTLDNDDPINDEIYDLLSQVDFILCGLEQGLRVSVDEL